MPGTSLYGRRGVVRRPVATVRSRPAKRMTKPITKSQRQHQVVVRKGCPCIESREGHRFAPAPISSSVVLEIQVASAPPESRTSTRAREAVRRGTGKTRPIGSSTFMHRLEAIAPESGRPACALHRHRRSVVTLYVAPVQLRHQSLQFDTSTDPYIRSWK